HRSSELAGPLARYIRPPEYVVIRQFDMLDARRAARGFAYSLGHSPAVSGDNEELCRNGLDQASVKPVDQGKRRDDLGILGDQSAPILGHPAGEVGLIDTEVVQQPIKTFLNAKCCFCGHGTSRTQNCIRCRNGSHSTTPARVRRQLTGAWMIFTWIRSA